MLSQIKKIVNEGENRNFIVGLLTSQGFLGYTKKLVEYM